MEQEKLNKKDYSKYDRQFMAFGSIMNSLQGYLAKQDDPVAVRKTIKDSWNLSKELVGNFVDELYASEKKEEIVQETFEV